MYINRANMPLEKRRAKPARLSSNVRAQIFLPQMLKNAMIRVILRQKDMGVLS